MTSSNVSNLLVQVSNISVEMSDSKVDVSVNKGLFEKTLKNVASPNLSNQVSQMDVTSPSKDNSNSSKEVKINSTKEVKVTNASDKSTAPKDKVTEKIEEVADEIKSIISEELDVSVEDIEKAMESLGFVALDLLNPQNLADLVANLTGEEDSISLILSEDFKFILDTVTELTNQLTEETGLTLADFKELIAPAEEKEAFIDLLPKDVALEDTEETPDVEIKTDEALKPGEQKELVIETEVSKEVTKEASGTEKTESLVEEPVSEKVTLNPSSREESSDDNFSNKKEAFKQVELPKTDKPIEIKHDAIVVNEPKVEPTFIPEQRIVALPNGTTVNSEDIVNQLVEQARVLNTSESTTMEMTLNPEGLGKIYLAITQKGDEITAKIFTENDAVKQALENQMANLRLEFNSNSSTKVTSIEVSVGAHEFERNLEEGQQDRGSKQEENESSKRRSRIDLNNLDELTGLMSEEDLLIAQMMQDNGNTLDYQA
jgi:flagellar hook-length control protein FliK